MLHRTTAKILAAALFSWAALAGSIAQAATVSLTANGHYFQGWALSNIKPISDPSYPGGYNCFSGPANLPPNYAIQGTLGPLNYEVTALTPAVPPADNQWQICNWYWGSYIPAGNDTVGAPGSVNYNKGNYDIVADRPFVPGTLMAFQDMDVVESALLTFKDCQGNTVDPASFDTLVLSSDYQSPANGGPMASSQYVPGSPPAWRFMAQGGVPNVAIGVLMKAPNICSIHLVGPTTGRSGGVAFYFASPPATTLTVNTGITGGPAGFSATLPVTPRCTVGGTDITAMLTPQPPQDTTASQSTPGQVVFNNVPIGAQCTVSAQSSTPAPQGLVWGPAPTAGPVTMDADASKNVVTLTQPLVQPAPVPTLDVWALLALAGLMSGAMALRRRTR